MIYIIHRGIDSHLNKFFLECTINLLDVLSSYTHTSALKFLIIMTEYVWKQRHNKLCLQLHVTPTTAYILIYRLPITLH